MRKSTKLIAAGAAMFFGAVWVTPWADQVPRNFRLAVGMTWMAFFAGGIALVAFSCWMRDEGK